MAPSPPPPPAASDELQGRRGCSLRDQRLVSLADQRVDVRRRLLAASQMRPYSSNRRVGEDETGAAERRRRCVAETIAGEASDTIIDAPCLLRNSAAQHGRPRALDEIVAVMEQEDPCLV